MKETKIPETKCPGCGFIADRATDAFTDRTAKPGDVSICFKCAAICQFIDGFELKLVTEKGLEELKKRSLSSYNNMMLAQKMIKLYHETKKI